MQNTSNKVLGPHPPIRIYIRLTLSLSPGLLYPPTYLLRLASSFFVPSPCIVTDNQRKRTSGLAIRYGNLRSLLTALFGNLGYALRRVPFADEHRLASWRTLAFLPCTVRRTAQILDGGDPGHASVPRLFRQVPDGHGNG
jgi:hypothetical protein